MAPGYSLRESLERTALRVLLTCRGEAKTGEHPFGPHPHVFKVGGRMFALVSSDPGLSITLKLEPLHGQLLRAQHPSVRPGYHMNKDHWNTITVDRRVLDDELAEWIDESYSLVVAKLSRRARAELEIRA